MLLKRELQRAAEGPLNLQRCSPHACEGTLEAEERTGKKEQVEQSSELTQVKNIVHAPTSQSIKVKTLKYVRY